jgi:hypothetical protein
VGLELVEHDVDLAVGVSGDHVVHEVEELGAPPALGVLGFDLAGGDLERREQGRSAAPLVFVGKASERPAAGQLEVALRFDLDPQQSSLSPPALRPPGRA